MSVNNDKNAELSIAKKKIHVEVHLNRWKKKGINEKINGFILIL